MAAPTIPNGETQFFPIIYEGNGTGQRVGKFVPFTDNGTIANSLIFNDGDSPYMRRTPSGAGNRKTFTISFWVKRCQLGVLQVIITQGADHNNASSISFSSSNELNFAHNDSGSTTYSVKTNRTFEDTSKFYHILASVDTTQSTASDRVKLYVDGDLITSFASSSYPSQDFDLDFNSTGTVAVSGQIPSGTLFPFDGYLTEINLVDGSALTPDTFGLTDTSTGRWIPKALTGITYGTNGFRLQFGTSSALGDDTSGNTNDFGTVSGLVAGDQTTDSPTQNHATINPSTASNGSMTFAEGNLNVEMNNAYPGNVLGTLGASSGKYYWEVTLSGTGSSANGYATGVGVAEWSKLNSDPGSTTSPFSSYIDSRGYYFHNGTNISSSTTFTAGDVIGIALNLDDSEISYFKNNTIVGSAQPLVDDQTYFPLFKNSTSVADLRYTPNFGQKSWNYTPPTGFVALQQDNLPETAKGITGMSWTKDRDSGSYNHELYDSSRGPLQELRPNTTDQENTRAQALSKFLKGGFAVGDRTGMNSAGNSYVSWNWVANSGTTATNNDGSITSTVQVNTTAGFSIVRWTGGGSAATVGHGLSQTPEWIFYKRTNATGDGWITYHKDQDASPANGSMQIQSDGTYGADSTLWNNTAPTSSVISIGTYGMQSGEERTAWVWHGVDGFSKFGKYTGNGSADGPFVYLGFRPAFVCIKRLTAGYHWTAKDIARDPINPMTKDLKWNLQAADSVDANNAVDFLSNGFKIRSASSGATNYNGSGVTHIYMAWAEHPFVGDGTSPVTAR
jgi:hypothetical protein